MEVYLLREEKLIQKTLVAKANREIALGLQQFCNEKYGTEEYYNVIKTLLDNKVLEIPNPQIYVEDGYFSNATTLSIHNMALAPCTYTAQALDINIPKEEPNFPEGKMAKVPSIIYYERYLAECTKLLHDLKGYYPTHEIEISDFMLAVYTLWSKAHNTLLKGVVEHYKEFFTAKMINQLYTSFSYEKGVEEAPNIKFICYDPVGLMVQAATWKKWSFQDRFASKVPLVTLVSYDAYNQFMNEFLMPMRSQRSLKKEYNFWNTEFRSVTEFNNDYYKEAQAIILAQGASMHYIWYDALKMVFEGKKATEVAEIIKDKVTIDDYNWIHKNYEKTKDRTDITYKYEFLDRNVKLMERRGTVFTKYNFNYNLLPPANIFSEVIINMDEFRKQFPSGDAQKFSEVYLMAHTINQAKRSFAKKYVRPDWNLAVKVISGSKEFEYTDVMEDMNTTLRSDEMDNFIGRIC